MDMLNDLMGGGRRNEYEDFVNRYDQGAPWDGIGDDEALERYRQVAPRLSDDDYRDSAEQAFSRLSPQQRAEFGQWLQQQSMQRGSNIGVDDGSWDDPRVLAGASARIRQQDPGMLEGLLGGMMGGGGGGMMGGGGMLGGMMGGGGSTGSSGGMLSSPIAKAVLGGVAAMAASKMMGRR